MGQFIYLSLSQVFTQFVQMISTQTHYLFEVELNLRIKISMNFIGNGKSITIFKRKNSHQLINIFGRILTCSTVFPYPLSTFLLPFSFLPDMLLLLVMFTVDMMILLLRLLLFLLHILPFLTGIFRFRVFAHNPSAILQFLKFI